MGGTSVDRSQDAWARPPAREHPPVVRLLRRLLFAVALVLAVAISVYAGRGGWIDDTGQEIGVLDAVYYATVSVTTTGYGDLTPVTSEARLATTLVVTPARVMFLLLLVGTTVELLTSQWREDLRRRAWRQRLRDHYVVCGYGTKGRGAVQALVNDGVPAHRIVAIDVDPAVAEQARRDGFAAIAADPSRVSTLEEARIRDAAAVVVATDRDATAVLATLAARELNAHARIVAAVREEENAHLLRESGADTVITTAESSGRLLGLTTRSRLVGRVVDDLLHTAEGFALTEREVTPSEVGGPVEGTRGQRTVAVLRGGQLLRCDDPRLGMLRAGDRILGLGVGPPERGREE